MSCNRIFFKGWGLGWCFFTRVFRFTAYLSELTFNFFDTWWLNFVWFDAGAFIVGRLGTWLLSSLRSFYKIYSIIHHASFSQLAFKYSISELEAGILKRALSIIFPYYAYKEALEIVWIPTIEVYYMYNEAICNKLFKEILQDKSNRLNSLLPSLNNQGYSLRCKRLFLVPKYVQDRPL